jgi:N-methylhydantoinase B/oxoprolinase/acetone carboxylase alpha subunit
MAPEITVSALLDRTRTHAWGLLGGSGGASARLLVKKNGDTQFRSFSEAFRVGCATKFTRVVLKQGDEVIIESPGGGGYGPPEKREASKIEEDLWQGYVSLQAGRTPYESNE